MAVNCSTCPESVDLTYKEEEEVAGSGNDAVARISKRRFALSDTYGIETTPGEDDGLILAVAVAIDEMAHDADVGDH